MTSIVLSSRNLPSRVVCPGSKSYANRALILAALREETLITNLPECEDTIFLREGLELLGVQFKKTNARDWEVLGGLERLRSTEEAIYLGEGGTTIRFFMALAGCLSFPVKMEVHPDFLARPMNSYKELLETLGVSVEVKDPFITVLGPYTAKGEVRVDCSLTTQFASALSLLEGQAGFAARPANILASKKYLEMTEYVKRELKSKESFAVPPDFSSFGYFAAYACLSSPIVVENVLGSDENQADSAILDIIQQLGGSWKAGEGGLEIQPIEEFRSIDVDGSKCIDLTPTLMFLFAYSGKKQIVRNIKNLRFKECDRLEAMLEMLSAFGVGHTYCEEKDCLVIQGQKPDGAKRNYLAPRDHRMVMTASLFLKINGGGEVAPKEAVNKSFPSFFEIFN